MASKTYQNGSTKYHKKPRPKYVAPIRDPNKIALPDREDLPEEVKALLFTPWTLPTNGGGLETSRWAPRQDSRSAAATTAAKVSVPGLATAQSSVTKEPLKISGLQSSRWAPPQKADPASTSSLPSSQRSRFNPMAKDFHVNIVPKIRGSEDSKSNSSTTGTSPSSRFNPKAKEFHINIVPKIRGSEDSKSNSSATGTSSSSSRFNPKAKEFHLKIVSTGGRSEDLKSNSSATGTSHSKSHTSFDPKAKEFTVSTMSPPMGTKMPAVPAVTTSLDSSGTQLDKISKSKITKSTGTSAKAQDTPQYVPPHLRAGYIPPHLRELPLPVAKEVPAHLRDGYVPPHLRSFPLEEADSAAPHLETNPVKQPDYVPPHLWTLPFEGWDNVQPHATQVKNVPRRRKFVDYYVPPDYVPPPLEKVDEVPPHRREGYIPPHLRASPLEQVENALPLKKVDEVPPYRRDGYIPPHLRDFPLEQVENVLPLEKIDEVPPHRRDGYIPPHLWAPSLEQVENVLPLEKVDEVPPHRRDGYIPPHLRDFPLEQVENVPANLEQADYVAPEVLEKVDYIPSHLRISATEQAYDVESQLGAVHLEKANYIPPHLWPGPFPESSKTSTESVSDMVTPSVTGEVCLAVVSKDADVANHPTAVPSRHSASLVSGSTNGHAKVTSNRRTSNLSDNTHSTPPSEDLLRGTNDNHVVQQEQPHAAGQVNQQMEKVTPMVIKQSGFVESKLLSNKSVDPGNFDSDGYDPSKAEDNGLVVGEEPPITPVACLDVTSLTREALMDSIEAAPADIVSDGLDMTVSETGIEGVNESIEKATSSHAKTPEKDCRNYLACPETHLQDWNGEWSPAPVDWEEERPSFNSAFVPEFISTWSNSLPILPKPVDMARTEFTSGLAAIICQGFAEPLAQPLTYPDVINSDNIDKQRLQTAEIDSKHFARRVMKRQRYLKREATRNNVDNRESFETTAPIVNPNAPKVSIYLRPAQKKDMAGITAIYNHYVLNSIVPEDQAEITEGQMHTVFTDARDEKLPFIVAIRGPAPVNGRANNRETVVGYARTEAQNYGLNGLHTGRSRYTGQTEVYVHPSHLRKGIGRSLLDRLLVCSSYAHPSKEGYSWICPNPRDESVYGQQGGVRQFHQLLMVRPFETKDDPDLPWLKKWLYTKFYFNEVGCMKSCGRSKRVGAPARFLDITTFQFEAALDGEFGMYA